jgi:hypothetical protein
MWILPVLTVSLMVAGLNQLVSAQLWLIPALIQGAIIVSVWSAARRHFDLVDARKPQLEAFARVLALIEGARFEAALLAAMQRRLASAGRRPSEHLHNLGFWTGLAETRMQILVHPPLILLLMWDLHILRGLQRWNEQAGRDVDDWLWVVAELEALCSLATLHAVDRGCTFPQILPTGGAFMALGLAHPLLQVDRRVANDVVLPGPGAALVITGSNMLRGTNARARAIGAAAVLRHLLAASSMGLVATHDPALCELAEDGALRVENVHLTDVLVDGEMAFDFRLRPGSATTSNALRLIELAGIDP